MTPTIKRRTAMKAAGIAGLIGLASGSSRGEVTKSTTHTPDRHGPMRTGRFKVEIDGDEIAGWQSVTIPSSSTEEGEYREGNDPDYEKKLWGQTTFDDLEMERGMYSGDTTIREWRDAVREGRIEKGTKKIAVMMTDQRGEPQITWEFKGAWIKDYDPPELDASADGDVATESITVAFDKMIRTEA